jgi:hypothetical protein
MRLGCHLIVSSLSRFVNTPSNVTAMCGTMVSGQKEIRLRFRANQTLSKGRALCGEADRS